MAMLVGHVLAMHANKGNSQMRVSVQRLAYETGTSKRTVIRATQELLNLGLLYRAEKGSDQGRQARASVYMLTVHEGLAALKTDFATWQKAHDESGTGATPAPDKRGRPRSDPWDQVSA